ncbi:unnamed protein product [Paramecium octaurelia]|uniref:Ammonium transporter AmtB-like domain-containing protein n=1 Tax=Paramecium octaurelia TaxID=43137 RepID=A0A8S1VR89_PAROT|nr:unnamed protein product [Paramecium octaurelia]
MTMKLELQYLMQLGFAFLEGGCVRYKNMQSIMIKVHLNTFIACHLSFFGWLWNLYGIWQICTNRHLWLLLFLSVAFSSFISICAHSLGRRLNQQLRYIDLAGSGTIHFMSAWGALVLTVMLGARNKDGMRNMTMNLTKVILPIFVYPLSLNSPYCIKLWANFFIGIRVDQHIGVLESQDRNFKIRNYKNQQNPVDAFPIHGGCGPIGAQFPGWSNAEKGIFYGRVSNNGVSNFWALWFGQDGLQYYIQS